MNIHIYKGATGKSVIFEQMISSWQNAIGFIYYTPKRPFPNCIDRITMLPREIIKEEKFVNEIIPDFLDESFPQTIIIYTNYQEKENEYLIEQLQNFESNNIVILMCAED